MEVPQEHASIFAQELREAVRAGGLFARDRAVVAMLSGGRDSTCLLDVALALLGPGAVSALAARTATATCAGRAL